MPEGEIQGQNTQETKPIVITREDIEAGKYHITTKVNGEETVKPIKDVWSRAQKDEAAERKLQELHDQETVFRERLDGAAFVSQGWEKQDGQTLIKGLVKLGIPEERAKVIVFGPDNAASDPHTGGSQDDDPELDDPRYAALQAQIQRLTEAVSSQSTKAQEAERQRTQLQQVAEALDKQPELAKIMKARATTPEAKKVFLRKAYEAVERRRQEFPTMGPRVIQAGLGDLLSELTVLGISPDTPTPPTSLGPSEISESGVHLSKNAKTMMDSTKDDEYVSIFDPKASASIMRDIARHTGLLKG